VFKKNKKECKQMKKILCLLLSGVIMVGTFAGCSKGGGKSTQDPGKEETTVDLQRDFGQMLQLVAK